MLEKTKQEAFQKPINLNLDQLIHYFHYKTIVMATSTNMLLQNLSGKLGKQLVIKQYAGKTVVSVMPDMSRRKLSPKQLLNNQRMAEANEEVQRIMRDDEMRDKAQLRLNVTRGKLYHALIREYFSAFRTEDPNP